MLLGDRVTGVEAHRGSLRVDTFGEPEDFRAFFKSAYGPTISVYRNLSDDPERTAALDAALVDLARDALEDGALEWEYLLLTARRGA